MKRMMKGSLLVVAVLTAVTACSSKVTPPLTPIRTRLTALLFGELVEVEGCLRVKDRDVGTSYLLAWGPEFAVSIENDAVQILHENGTKIVLHIGEMVRISGGEVKSVGYLDEQVRQTLPAGCPGPYWFVGTEVSALEGAKEPK